MARAAAAKKAANGAAPRGRGRPRKQAVTIVPPRTEDRRNSPQPHETAGRLAELTRLKTESRRIAGAISALGKEAKAAGGRAYWTAIKRTHDLLKLDPDEARAGLEMLVQVAAQSEIRISWVGDQAALTDILEQNQPPPKNTKGSRDLAAARAEADGFNSGKNGALPHDNPFNPGSEQYVAWHDGRDAGQQAREAKNPGQAARVHDALAADASLPGEGALADPETF